MKTMFSVLLLATSAALTSISPVAAQSTFPKEGDVAFSGVFHGMSHSVSMGEDVSQYSYEAMGGLLAEKEGSLPDRMSVRCVGGGRVVKGALEGETGMCEYIDLSGDKLFTTTSSTKGEIPGTVSTKHTLAGGTGKYTGITGGWTGARRSLRSPIEGQGISAVTYKGSYRLP
jgi:hypothetical protein